MSSPFALTRLAAAALIALMILFSAGPITDIDFWWHIANGRWIWEHGTLPTVDPFGVYERVNYWARTILQGQWGGQVLLYLLFESAGAPGIIALRIAIMLSVAGLIDWRMRRAGASAATRWVALTCLGAILSGFMADRPQLFSLALFSLLAALMELSASRARMQWYCLPVLILWTNVHQAVLLGSVLVAIWALILALQERDPCRRTIRHQRFFFAAAALAAPLMTPNGLRGIQYLLWLESEPARQRISEYLSPIAFADNLFAFPHLLAYFCFAAALAITLVLSARKHPRESAVLSILLAASLWTYRYIPFAVIMGLPLVATTVADLCKRKRVWIVVSSVLLIALAASCAMTVTRNASHLGTQVSSKAFPLDLVAGERQFSLQGRGFTSVAWGGFLTWHVGDRATPYIDGRYLMDTRRVDGYTHILWATEYGRALFARERFDWVLLPQRNALVSAAPTYPILDALRRDPEWELRALTEQGALFVRKKP